MDKGTGDWEGQGPEDISMAERVIADPLLELAAELVLCYDAVDEHRGSFCSSCTCQLSYHLPCDDGVCELCNCDVIHWLCKLCGKSREMDSYPVGKDGETRVCKFCAINPPVRILPNKDRDRRRSGTNSAIEVNFGVIEEQERAKAARQVLLELTE